MKTFCIYHRVDLDGKCSAAIVLRRFPEAILVPYQYGDPIDLEQFRGNRVFMVDCALQPFERMIELFDICEVTWIDHHKTAIEEYDKIMEGERPFPELDVLDVEKAGCELTWGALFPDEELPLAVWLLGRYDVWDLGAHETVMPFQWGMRQHAWAPDAEGWGWLWEAGNGNWRANSIIEQGRTILAYVASHNAEICAFSFDAEIDGLRCICMNVARGNSQIFESVWDPEKYDAVCAFYNAGGEHWTISLYTDKPGVNVGAVAKGRGGGGHLKAAGWQCAELPEGFSPS